jgi:hypothetical protein
MRSIVYGLVSCFIVLSSNTIVADAHGGIHIHTTCGEVVEDDQPSNVCLELKPWYHRQHFEDDENIEEQSERLEDDTAWPGQREEFSDYLMR